MATLALAAVGAAAGSAFLPAGVSVLGATLSGAAIGSQIGALAGSYVDQALFASSGESRVVEGPRLRELHVMSSTEGAPIPRILGRVRLGGQLIWATDFEEVAVTSSHSTGGGKGGGGGGGSVEQVDYRYYANFAIAIAQGEVTALGRVWADGQEIDISRYTTRIYYGGGDQEPDSLISAVEGSDAAPAFRGVAYIVFERFPLAAFGNRLPQLSFEVTRMQRDTSHKVRGVVVIPGSGEFVYGAQDVVRELAPGVSESENVHSRLGATDWSVSMDQLQVALPEAKTVSLVVSWFGTDLRAGECQIKPGVEISQKKTSPWTWSVSGVGRSDAHVVSLREGRPAYGGTPSDQAVVDAIRDLSARGIKTTVTPFVLMDVPDGNALADPYGGDSQAVYPWRGRITCHPAPGVDGSPDKTPAAGVQVGAFMGAAAASDFSVVGDEVQYSGPAEWSYRRMVLHMAHLAKAAGGVDSFLIGSELRGLTQIRDGQASFPFVAGLMALAADVKAILGPDTKVSYAADWSEYFGFQPTDGSGDVYFHLDPLWASPAIDAIGIDCYWPLSDWRDGTEHLDAAGGARSNYDLKYLRGNVQGGEGFDWYYASQEDREAQVRTPITDGLGKPWVFRVKDIKNWWSSPHYDRPAGVETAQATAWQPSSKPIWFTEIGCPAIDKGANQPNVFVDPKSSENATPYFSTGARDDLIQRRYVSAFVEHFAEDTGDGFDDRNPVSSVYGGRMVDPHRLYVYCWDARPYPAFPNQMDVWGDGENWFYGHWLNGRVSAVSLDKAVADILHDGGFLNFDVTRLEGLVPGYMIDRVMSSRDALQPLSLGYFFDAIESGPLVRFQHRFGGQVPRDIDVAALAEASQKQALVSVTRRQETELPATAKLTYISGEAGYEQAVAEARRLAGESHRVSQAELPVVLESFQAGRIAETWLHEAWTARETSRFDLSTGHVDLEPGDLVRLHGAVQGGQGRSDIYRIMEVRDHGAREVEAMRLDPRVYGVNVTATRAPAIALPVAVGRPDFAFLDLPLLTGSEDPGQGYVASYQSPWPGGVAVYVSPDDAGFELRRLVSIAATMGETLSDLSAGVPWRRDYSTALEVDVRGGTLASVSEQQLLAGANAAALQHADGRWEVLQFERATLVAENRYRLDGLLRGQSGTEVVMRDNGLAEAGARFVLINSALSPIGVAPDELRLALNWRVGPVNQDLGADSYVSVPHAYQGVGYRPYAPVRVTVSDVAEGLRIDWLRRTRVGGDGWHGPEVPLSEEDELYEVDVLDGDVVVRTVSTGAPTYTYPNALRMNDFSGLQSGIGFRVAQVSAIWGRGSVSEVYRLMT